MRQKCARKVKKGEFAGGHLRSGLKIPHPDDFSLISTTARAMFPEQIDF